MAKRIRMNRRRFVKTTIMAAAATAIIPELTTGCSKTPQPMKRVFGKLGFEVTTLGLGGQASLQWTPDDVDPVEIILKAFYKGINYFDTSNLYGPSQMNYGKAFNKLNLIPGKPGYDEPLRKSIFLTTKTHLRLAKGGTDVQGVSNWTNGEPGTHTVDDLHRSLSQMFGDGNGNYPEGSYIDMMLFHNLNTKEEVDAIYEGIENTDPDAERIGALAALRDYRDGTNLTGLNPKNEKLIRHIGFSGHFDPSVNMYMIQRDHTNLLDAMLVAINANDKLMFNMQHNVIPLAAAKKMGIIGMKVFADGAMYSKPAEWSEKKEHVVRTIGDQALPSKALIQYALTTPDVHLAIIGIGQVSNRYEECQLSNNLDAAQILPDGLTSPEREAIEIMAKKVKEGNTNYFQNKAIPVTAPKEVTVKQSIGNNVRSVTVSWSTAYAADAPLKTYEILRDGNKVNEQDFTLQLTTDPLTWTETLNDKSEHSYIVKVTDIKGREAFSNPVLIEKV
jgi:aryl-alcohol dehydrogenase-like predicted oxidoreductase